MILNSRKSVIDFTSYITERTINFTGREWVFQAINEWLANPTGSRFFLLTGEPGSGKSAIAARLSQFSQGLPPPDGLSCLTSHFLSAVHFCSASDNLLVDPFAFSGSIATQLANRYPAYLKVLLDVQQDQNVQINVAQNVQTVEKGQVIGVNINVNAPSPESAFNRVVREPLEVLFHEGFEQQVVILVDALDEALSYSGKVNIISLLASVDNLPNGIRFILTSRLETDVLRPFRRYHSKELTLTSGHGLTQSLQDVQLYTQFTLDRNPALGNKLAPGLSRQALITAIQEKSEGNFLYVRYLLNMLQEQLEQITLTQLDTLPTGLDGIYLEFLERLVKSDTQSWENKYAPILGALAVAQIPLNEAQLSNLTGQTELSMTLKRLHQLLDLDETLPLSQRTYTIYHRSFIDFLLDVDRSEEYGRDAKREHLHLAIWCEKGNLSVMWEDVKYSPGEQGRRQYARQFYITHLFQAREWQRLFAVLDEGVYGQAKVRYNPSMRLYAQDLNLGRQAASSWGIEQGIQYLAHLWRYTLLQCSLTVRAYQYPAAAFTLMMRLGYEAKALELAELIIDPKEKAERLMIIAANLIRQPDRETDGLQMFSRTQEVIRLIDEESERADALMELASILTIVERQEDADRVWEEAIEISSSIADEKERATKLREIARSLIDIKRQEDAQRVLAMVEQASASIVSLEERVKALVALASTFLQLEQWTNARRVIASIPVDFIRVDTLRELAFALALAGEQEDAQRVFAEVEHATLSLPDDEFGFGFEDRAERLAQLATALAQVGQREDAQRILIEVRQAASSPISSKQTRYSVLRELATALMQLEQWEEAEQVSFSIPDSEGDALLKSSRDRALIDLAAGLAQHELWPDARGVIASIQEENARAEALKELATALAQHERWVEAEQVGISIVNVWRRSQALATLADVLIERQHWDDAGRVIASIPEGEERVQALRMLAIALAQSGIQEDAEQAWEVWLEAIQVSAKEQRVEMRIWTAAVLAERGLREDAQ
jgi:hypothetical protein